MRILLGALPAAMLFAAAAVGQCNGPDPLNFANNTSGTGNALNVITFSDSTNNQLTTPGAQDNAAVASTGEPIAITVSSVAGAPGSPLSILFSAGGPAGPLFVPFIAPGAEVYINFGSIFGTLVDGAGVLGTPINPFIAHPGPANLFSLFSATTNIPGLTNTCWTVQSAILDPTAAAGIRLSNAAKVGFRPGISSISPNFGPEASTPVVATAGTTSGQLNYTTFNPQNSTTLPPTSPSPGASPSGVIPFPVPAGAGSGPVTLEDAGAPGVPSISDPDDMKTWFAVTDPFGLTASAGVTNPLTMNVSPFALNETFLSIQGALASATAVDQYTLAALAGDIVTIECYSLNAAANRLLDGFGSTYNPAAAEGFDPAIELRHVTNVNALLFDTGTGPFLVDVDDDGGPGFNSRMIFQPRFAGNLRIDVRTNFGAAFVTGGYVLNIRVKSGQPCVSSFQVSVTANSNAAAAGGALTLNGANFTAGAAYDVILTPVHGLYAPVTVASISATSATAMTFNLPPLAAGTFTTGSHYVNVRAVSDGATSLRWSTQNVTFLGGVVPDLLVVKSSSSATLTGTNTAIITNTQTYVRTNAAGAFTGFVNFQVLSAANNVYIEVLGTDAGTAQRRIDSVNPLSGTAGQGVYNPNITLFAANIIVAQNDNDGVFPVAYNWQNNGSPGVGQSAAILTPPILALGTYLLLYGENICWVSCTTTKEMILNVVVL